MYGIVPLFSAIEYFILSQTLIAIHGGESILATAVGRDFKGKILVVIYLVAIRWRSSARGSPEGFTYSWQ
ncbi:MAG: hypothetical protein JW963_10755 [Anaerolineales bacterium]|nr:hypothetical protein [Anaerolineales bacterium]